jgi:hypothetical protein
MTGVRTYKALMLTCMIRQRHKTSCEIREKLKVFNAVEKRKT